MLNQKSAPVAQAGNSLALRIRAQFVAAALAGPAIHKARVAAEQQAAAAQKALVKL